MARWRRYQAQLASGIAARVVRIDCAGFRVLPAFDAPAPEAETRIAQVLNKARLGIALRPVAPAAQRLPQPGAPDAAGVVQLSQRRRTDAPEVAMLAPMRLLRLMAGGIGPDQVLVNGNYFLFSQAELARRFDAFGDPIGLVMAGGEVLNPPLYPRAVIATGPAGPQVLRIGFNQIGITGADARPYLPHAAGPAAYHGAGWAYAEGFGCTGARPPAITGLWDVAFCGRHPVAYGPAGCLDIPRAGAVLRTGGEHAARALAAGPLRYDLGTPFHNTVQEAVQAGPQIIADGRIIPASADVFATEAMAPGGHWPMVSPHGWPADWQKTRAARLGAGISAAGDLAFWLVEGSSSSLRDAGAEGATLHDLAMLMLDGGAVAGLHLDGGGSAQGFVQGGGALVQSGEIHKGFSPGAAAFDRALPLGVLLD